MDKALIEKVARAIHMAMVHSPAFEARGRWEDLFPGVQSEYRAITHSALVAAGQQHVWVVTEESDREDRNQSSVLGVFDSRESALEALPREFGGAEEIVWTEHSPEEFSGMYDEHPWVMALEPVQDSQP